MIKEMQSNYSVDGNGIKTSIMQLKTATPGVTKAEAIKTGFSNVNDYTQYLQGKYSFMNSAATSMCGIPTTVSVSAGFLRQCMKDPQRAAYLEENLKAIPGCVKSLDAFTKTMPGSPVCTYATYLIDDNGNITCMSGCTNDPDGKIAKENAEKKEKEARRTQQKAAEKREKERIEKEKEAERRAEKELLKISDDEAKASDFAFSVTGTSVKGVTQSIITSVLAGAELPAFDVTG